MPKIPMAEKAGLIRHESDTVHMQGAPPLNWKLDEGQALINMGEKIERGAEKLGHSMMAFGQHMQHQEDVLAATEDRNLFAKLNGELENKLANTPGAPDEEKQKWISDYKQMYENGRKEFLDRMSGNFRKQHDAEMNGLRIKAQNTRIMLLNQGRVQRVTDMTLALLKEAALRGDAPEYRRILDQAQDGEYPLFSAEMRKRLETNFQNVADSGEAKRLVDADPAAAVEKLKERDSKGNYANFTALESSRRDALLRAAEAEQGRRERTADLQILEEFRNGSANYTKEFFDKALADKKITLPQHSRYMQWMREFEARQKRAADYQASQKEKAEKAVRQQAADRFLNNTLYDEDGRSKILSDTDVARAAKRAREICGLDYGMYGDLLGKLKTATEKKNAWKETEVYKDGDSLIAQFKAEGKLTAIKERRWIRSDLKDTSYPAERYVERQLRIDLEEFVKNHPKAGTPEAAKYLTDRLELYNKKTLEEIGAMQLQRAQTRRENAAGKRIEKSVGSYSGTYNGRKVVKKNGKWYYAE